MSETEMSGAPSKQNRPRINKAKTGRLHRVDEASPEKKKKKSSFFDFCPGELLLFTFLLIFGLVISQILPLFVDTHAKTGPHHIPLEIYHVASNLLRMTCLSFIMFHVGLEFEVEKAKGCAYVTVDIVVSVASAFLAWGLCVAWFVIALPFAPCYGFADKLKDSVLTAHFAASTSAGVLFSMLAAANLSSSWTYRKARVLAIFDDLATIISIIPVKVLYIGLEWSMAVQFTLMAACLTLAFAGTHKLGIPYIWPAVLTYAALLAITSESVYVLSVEVLHKYNFEDIHIEVMLPAFAIGCASKVSHGGHGHSESATDGDEMPSCRDALSDAAAPGAVMPLAVANASILNKQSKPKPKPKPACLTKKVEATIHLVLCAIFMVLVGLSMPGFGSTSPHDDHAHSANSTNSTNATVVGVEAKEDCTDPVLTVGETVFHVFMVTILQNFGKMLPMVFYTSESSWRERLALSLGMCPRGEVGAAILVISTTLGVTGPIVVVSALSLALNLALTGVFITVVKVLLEADVKRKIQNQPAPSNKVKKRARQKRNRAMSGHFIIPSSFADSQPPL